MCSRWKKVNVSMTTMRGERCECMGMGEVHVQLLSGPSVTMRALVMRTRPLGFDFVMGMNGINALRGVTVRSLDNVKFGIEESEVVTAAATALQRNVDEKDFGVTYDVKAHTWTVSWKWSSGTGPPRLQNTVSEYRMPQAARQEYENELCQWIKDGWLVPYSKVVHGPVRGTIPLMAVVQRNKKKVRPVMDFRELKSYLDVHTADVDVCAEKIREWRRRGQRVALLDLRKAYLQIHVHQSLWSYQTVVFRGMRYCLTRLGFGLSIAPLVPKKVLSTVLSWDEIINSAASPYLDDILVDESVASAAEVENHLSRHDLICKPAERVHEGARVLGMRVWGERRGLFWKRDNNIADMPEKLTRRTVFSLCGQLTSHLPVCGWLSGGIIPEKACQCGHHFLGR
ncbi:hypothetical protein GWK47_002949 [Chionoecetes opilio]|uniref:DUF7047 domain-containing protein n=1 Tax=Chionoecetes opilio TaxID=41210 RepID=A0A8J8WFG4_CHIOP|nr:hypothetical protein GWK47_002949 [Chionoecetes opilio]